jgi:glutamate 5-kinase
VATVTSPLAAARRVVLKVGSSLLIDPATGAPARAWAAEVAGDVAAAHARGLACVLVSSGAVGLGRRALKLEGKLRLEEKQAAAAAGQSRLMRAWEDAFEALGLPVAQILLTPDETERRRRWLNARATLETLLERGAVPVVNENDTVATQELRYGDNDRLAARVAQMISADVLILLSDVDGLYDRDPRAHSSARRIDTIEAITPEIEAMAGGANALAGVGTGGMRTKIEAAKIATAAGCAVAVTSGADPRALSRLAAGGAATWFLAGAAPKAAYKAWIAGRLDARGALSVDAGAAHAVNAGKSLLAAGVVAVHGPFEKGEAVRVLGPDGKEIARGLVRYDAADAERVKGLRSGEIEPILGWNAGPLIHADDMAR